MQESESAATHYDKVYTAPRPELFFKAIPIASPDQTNPFAFVPTPAGPFQNRSSPSSSAPT